MTPSDPTRFRDAKPPSGDTRVRAAQTQVPGAETLPPRSDEFQDGTYVRDPSRPTLRPAEHLDFELGYKVRGRYELEQRIGQGAMGEVWRAKDLLSEEAQDRSPYIALKVLNSDFENHPDAFIALHREASRAQKLAHPNIVTVYVFDRDERSGRAFIAMELLEGRPLDRILSDAGAGGLPAEQGLPIIRGMAEGLAYAHRKGIVHSDFKPANVFVTADGTPKILDFGIARAVHTAGVGDRDAANADNPFQGYTLTYAAPEAISGGDPNTAEDVFALGLVAFELLSGRHPFGRKSATEAQAAGIIPPTLRGLKRRECRAIERALAFEPGERFPDAAAFIKALQGIAPLQKALAAVVVVLAITAGTLWYRNYVVGGPEIPFEQLPAQTQTDVRGALTEGDEALQYLERTRDITGSQDAAFAFAKAYALHPRNRQAVEGLERAADLAIEWYSRLPDRQEGLVQLRLFQKKSEFYETYTPLLKAIDALSQD